MKLRINAIGDDHVSLNVYTNGGESCGALILPRATWDALDIEALDGDTVTVEWVPVDRQQAEGGAVPRASRAAREEDAPL